LNRQYGDRVRFYVVYIQEAHPTDGWQVPDNEQEQVLYATPQTAGEREQVATSCVLHLNLSIPTLLDGMTNDVDLKYAALPDRLYLIGADGRIVYRSGPGPWGFKPDELEVAIKEYLAAGVTG
jgi:hypothetical protein